MLIYFKFASMKAGKRERLYIVLEPEASNEAQVYIEEFERTIRTIECELLASTDTSHIIQELLRHKTLEQLMANPNAAAKLFHQLKEIEIRLTDMQPKAEYYNALVEINVLTSIRQTAKELCIPEKLFTYLLVEMGFAYRTPKKLLMPYAFMVTSGFAELKEYINGKHGGVYMLFTPVGRLYLMRKMHQRLGIKPQIPPPKE